MMFTTTKFETLGGSQMSGSTTNKMFRTTNHGNMAVVLQQRERNLPTIDPMLTFVQNLEVRPPFLTAQEEMRDSFIIVITLW